MKAVEQLLFLGAWLLAPAAVAAQVPQIKPPPGPRSSTATPPNAMMTLFVPLQLENLHPAVQHAVIECKIVSYDASGNRFNFEADGSSDTLTVPASGTLSQDVPVHVYPRQSGTPTDYAIGYECKLFLGTSSGEWAQPCTNCLYGQNPRQTPVTVAFRARTDRPFARQVSDSIP